MLSQYLLNGKNKRLKRSLPVVWGFPPLFGGAFVHVKFDFRFLPSVGVVSVSRPGQQPSRPVCRGGTGLPVSAVDGGGQLFHDQMPTALAAPSAVELKHGATLFQSYWGDVYRTYSRGKTIAL